MKISISATNPCHLYPVAAELAALGSLGAYYSGYPKWKLPGSDAVAVRPHSWRTNAVYGLLKYFPGWAGRNSRSLFLWQDSGFDRWVGKNLEPCDFIHAMPGQCLHTFRRAKALGIRTVLNHATGPVCEWVRIMEPEYARAGLKLTDVCPYDAEYFRREDEEYALADYHCAASTVVRDALVGLGIEPGKIWTAPYGADTRVFHGSEPGGAKAPDGFRIVFAGQAGLRKGMRTLLRALQLSGRPDWRVDFYGAVLPEARGDLREYSGKCPLEFHGPVSQAALAEAFRAGSVLVLPSLEEGFGLVVPQALNCGLPCIVSDRVGAKDLIRQGVNGSIFPAEDAEALLRELAAWEKNPARPQETHLWSDAARRMLTLSMDAL